MAKFEVTVCEINQILDIDGADAIQAAKIGDYISVIKKHQFKLGDKCIYIPEGSLIPDDLLQKIGLTGKLAGPGKNRVKAIKLRGIISQGICIDAPQNSKVGDDFAEQLGIIKWKPEIPTHLAGNCAVMPDQFVLHYDINDIKKYNSVFSESDEVVMTEKVHGTLCCFAIDVETGEHYITSKGLMGRGLYLKNDENNINGNFYHKVFEKCNIKQKLLQHFCNSQFSMKTIHVFGEGFAVQDLKYGHQRNDYPFVAFDIFVDKKALDFDDFVNVCNKIDIKHVPILYRGFFSKESLHLATNGKETISGKMQHVREGCVVKSLKERYVKNLPLERAQLKSVSHDYLLRKNEDATEFD